MGQEQYYSVEKDVGLRMDEKKHENNDVQVILTFYHRTKIKYENSDIHYRTSPCFQAFFHP